MKKIFIPALVFFFALAPHVLAQGFVPLAPIPGLTEGATANSAGLAVFFNNLYKYLIGLAAALAVVQIIWGGLEISTQDSVSKNKDGKDRIYQAIFGLVLVLSPVLVFSIINPSILNLSLNLPALDTKSTTTGNTTSTTQDAPPPAADTSIRESSGVQTIFAFTIPSGDTMSLLERRRILNEKQTECTQRSNGLGFIMPPAPQTNVYTCQTCPTGTTLRLQSARDGATPLGTCEPN